MHVIGTAGHVDHGKTTLIEALTGINPDRLPEEKARGMTIDLGFAWFTGANGEPVGVIDVPGHERFIRNMVAGAWSLDCALLLVAADDGWMQQTQDHAVVLAALDIAAVILVVTKADAVSPERVEEVRRDALQRAARIFGATPPSIAVAALARRNIDELKALIVATLAGLPDPRGAGLFPYLYVDRVFSIKGSGLVVTGSLKGGSFRKDEELVLLPQDETVRIRGMQTYNTAVEAASATSRVALNLPKTRGEIARGNCLAPAGAPFVCDTGFVARITPVEQPADASETEEPPVIRNHSEVEVALGTGHEIALLHFMDDRRFARIEMRHALPALWNQPFLVIRHGGSTILGTGRVLWFGEVPREDRRRLTAQLAELPERLDADEDRMLLELRFFGLVRLPAGAPAAPVAAPAAPVAAPAAPVAAPAAPIAAPAAPIAAPAARIAAESVIVDQWAFHTAWLETITAEVRAHAQAAGISLTELEGKVHVDFEPLKRVLAVLVDRKSLFLSNGLYFSKPPGDKQELSSLALKLMKEIDAAGPAGFDSTRTGIEGGQKELKMLVRLGMVIPMEGGICYGRTTYEALSAAVLKGRSTGDRFSIPEAKERTGLSRKYMIPLLNRMEKDGSLKRDGDVRVVLKPR
jgi:selenocysteine-specific elongation factor